MFYLKREEAGIHGDLVEAAALGDMPRAQVLLAAGADPRFQDSLPLRAAAMMGRFDMIRELVAAGADPLADNHGALLLSALRGDIEIAAYLIEKGAQPGTVLEHHKVSVNAACLATFDALTARAQEAVARQSLDALRRKDGRGKGRRLSPRKPEGKGPRR
jgi:ankyrin repeat protein